MRIHINHICIFLGFILFINPNLVNAQQYYFNYLTAEDGLSSNILNYITKDTRGYLWVGCDNALNRYDGSKFIKYVHNPKDSTSITGGAIRAVFEDKDGILWVSTTDGVCTFDYKSEKFTKIRTLGIENTSGGTFYVTKKKEFILCSQKGLYVYEKTLQGFVKYLKSNVDVDASLMLEDRFGNLLIGTWGKGVIVVEQDRKNYIVQHFQAEYDSIGANSIVAMVLDNKGTIWFGTRNGLYTGNILNNRTPINFEIKPVLDKERKLLPISNSMIHSMIFDDTDKLWIGTENGLNIYDHVTQNLQILYSIKNSPESLNNNLITCLFNEPNSGIWIGTYQGGMNFYSKGNTPFDDKIPFITQSDNKLIQYVKSVNQSPDGKLWIGTDYGLFGLTKDFQLLKTYKNSTDHGSLAQGGVTAIFTDKSGEFWIGTWGGGINRLDKGTGEFVNYSKLDGENINDTTMTGDVNVIAFAEDRKGYLWIVNKIKIVDRFNRKTNSFKHINVALQVGRPNMEINSAIIDADDNLWIGATSAGLIKFDTKSLKAELFAPYQNKNLDTESSIPSVDVYSVHIAKSGKIHSCSNDRKQQVGCSI